MSRHSPQLGGFRRLAEVLVAGEWSLEGLIQSLQAAAGGKRRRWQERLGDEVWNRFGDSPIPPLLGDLTSYLRTSRAARRVASRTSGPDGTNPLDRLDPLRTGRDEMRPHPAIRAADGLPPLRSTRELAEWLGISLGELDWFAGMHRQEARVPTEKLRHYRYRWIARRGRRPRLIEAPKPRLKQLQRIILDELISQIPVHPAAVAFRKGTSILDALSPHAGQRMLLRMDLCDFFAAIPASRVMAVFRTVGYPERVARCLAAICTNAAPEAVVSRNIECGREPERWHRFREDHLPQGAPTSPVLANLCAYRLDRRLEGLARRFHARYTRYADDLLFSGGDELARSMGRFRTWALAILLNESFTIQDRKTRCMPHGGRQSALGLTVNEKPNVSRREYDLLKAILFNCCRFGPKSQNRNSHPRFREHLQGRIAWFAQVNHTKGTKLQELFSQIEW